MNKNTQAILILSCLSLQLTNDVAAKKDGVKSTQTSPRKAKLEQQLIDAIYNEDTRRIRSLFNELNVNDIIDSQGKTPLMISVAFDKINPDALMDIETQKQHLKSPRREVVETIIQSGADIKKRNRSKQTALHFAAAGSREIVQLLLDRGGKAILEARDTFKNTPLQFAEQNVDTLKALLEAGANVDAKDSDGDTTLSNTVQALAPKRFNTTPPTQHNAVRRLIKNCIEVLLQYRANPNIPNKEGMTPLMYAAQYGEPDVVETLLKAKASAGLRNNNGKTALQLAQEGLQQAENTENDDDESQAIESKYKNNFRKVIVLLTK